MKKALCVAGVFGLAAAAGAEAQIARSTHGYTGGGASMGTDATLWDQSAADGSGFAGVDQDFGDYPSYSSFLVNDVSTGGAAWNVSKVTTYFTKSTGAWSTAINSGKLQVYSKTGSLPGGGDTPPEYTVPVTLTDLGSSWAVSADTSGVAELQGINGDFWLGLTPTADFGRFGQEWHLQASGIGNNTAFRNPGGGFGLGSSWMDWSAIGGAGDSTLLVEGTVVPAPGALGLLGLGGLAACRRRR